MQEIRKALMGHSSGEDVHAIYTHVELPAKREAIRKLEAWVNQQAQSQLKGENDVTQEKHSEADVRVHLEGGERP